MPSSGRVSYTSPPRSRTQYFLTVLDVWIWIRRQNTHNAAFYGQILGLGDRMGSGHVNVYSLLLLIPLFGALRSFREPDVMKLVWIP